LSSVPATPGWSYDGADPDGYMTAGEVVAYLDRYARSFGAPVKNETTEPEAPTKWWWPPASATAAMCRPSPPA
jgi:hypothetical protein